MEFIEVPYSAEGPKGWTIPIPGDGERRFASRDDAMGFALTLVKASPENGENGVEPSYLCVEGGDGRWRLFTADLQPAA